MYEQFCFTFQGEPVIIEHDASGECVWVYHSVVKCKPRLCDPLLKDTIEAYGFYFSNE
jgi:hypothetical protein